MVIEALRPWSNIKSQNKGNLFQDFNKSITIGYMRYHEAVLKLLHNRTGRECSLKEGEHFPSE